MYAIYGNIYHQYTPNVSIYTIHGSYGRGTCRTNFGCFWCRTYRHPMSKTLRASAQKLTDMGDFWGAHHRGSLRRFPDSQEKRNKALGALELWHHQFSLIFSPICWYLICRFGRPGVPPSPPRPSGWSLLIQPHHPIGPVYDNLVNVWVGDIIVMDINRAYKILSNKHNYGIPWGPGLSIPIISQRARQQGGYPGQGYTPGYHGQAPTMNFQAHHVRTWGVMENLGNLWWNKWWWKLCPTSGGILSYPIYSELGQIMLVNIVNRMGWSIIVLSLVDSPTLGDAEGILPTWTSKFGASRYPLKTSM